MFIPFKDPPYIWSDQAVIRTITKIFTLPKWSLTSKVHNLHTIWPMPITDKISHLSSPQTAKDSQDAILNSQTCLYTNLLLMTLLELGFTHTSSCGCHIQMCEPQQLYYTSCICTILCAWWHASLMFIHNPTCEITFMIILFCRYITRLILCCWQKLMNVILWLFISF